MTARRAGLGWRGSGCFFFGPASNRFVFGDAALGVFAGVVGRSHVLRGRVRTGRRRRRPPVDPGQQQALGLFSFEAEGRAQAPTSDERRCGQEGGGTVKSWWTT